MKYDDIKFMDYFKQSHSVDLHNRELFDELVSYANNARAEFVYYKCLLHKKLKWAEEIKKKYNIKVKTNDVAMCLAIMYSKIKSKNETK